jgi:hypothetical protein
MYIIQPHQTTTATREQVLAGRPGFAPECRKLCSNGADSLSATAAVDTTDGRS